jgi:hypothetical protein
MLLAICAAGCLPRDAASDASNPAEDRPVVGRLRYQDRTIDLSVDAFGEGPRAVDPGSYAHLMADRPLPRKDDQRDPQR